jgi:hypothetical protein
MDRFKPQSEEMLEEVEQMPVRGNGRDAIVHSDFARKAEGGSEVKKEEWALSGIAEKGHFAG